MTRRGLFALLAGPPFVGIVSALRLAKTRSPQIAPNNTERPYFRYGRDRRIYFDDVLSARPSTTFPEYFEVSERKGFHFFMQPQYTAFLTEYRRWWAFRLYPTGALSQ